MIEQRGLLHKLRHVADKCREDLKEKEHKEERKQVLTDASRISQAESAAQARSRLAAFADQWRARAPKAVATLERDFEPTIASSRLEGIARELIGTTSFLERTNRQRRRKFRQVGSFGSQSGAEVALSLQMQRLHARWMKAKKTWRETSLSLYFDFLILHP